MASQAPPLRMAATCGSDPRPCTVACRYGQRLVPRHLPTLQGFGSFLAYARPRRLGRGHPPLRASDHRSFLPRSSARALVAVIWRRLRFAARTSPSYLHRIWARDRCTPCGRPDPSDRAWLASFLRDAARPTPAPAWRLLRHPRFCRGPALGPCSAGRCSLVPRSLGVLDSGAVLVPQPCSLESKLGPRHPATQAPPSTLDRCGINGLNGLDPQGPTGDASFPVVLGCLRAWLRTCYATPL